MPDTEISQLPELSSADLQASDPLPIADISARETKKLTVQSLFTTGTNLVPDGSINPGKIDWSTSITGQIGGSALIDRSVPAVKIVANSLTSAEIAVNAIGSAELADNAVDTAALGSLVVTTAKIAGEAITSSKIGINQVAHENLAIDSVDSDNIINLSVTSSKIANRAVNVDKLATPLPGSILDSNSISENNLIDESVTTDKLGFQAVTTAKLADSSVTNEKIVSLDGGKLQSETVAAFTLDPAAFSNGIELDGTVQLVNEIIPGTQAGIEWNSNGMIVGTTSIPATDLPIATTTVVGAISVPASSGMVVSADGALDSANKIDPATVSGFTYNQNGNIISTRKLISSDLPNATAVTKGACSFPTAGDSPLVINADAEVTHAASGISPGSYVNLTVNQYGLATAGTEQLSVNQVPGLDASKITSGQFATPRIADRAITMPKLANYSVSYIQEVQPTLNLDVLHIGCYWYQPSTAQLRIWDGNVWASVGFGRLSQENLRFGGVIDADTGLVLNTTDAGRTAGLTVGAVLPVATDPLGGLYVVVGVAGSNIAVTPGVTYDAGDWCLCINATDGWIRIDTLTGGGSGGAQRLNDLLDVDINNVQIGDTLIYTSAGNWENQTTTADRVSISPAFDGSTVSFTASMDILDQNNVILSVGGVILEPGVDFTIDSGTRQLNFATPPPLGSSYFLLNQQTVNASGGGGGGNLPPGTVDQILVWNDGLNAWSPSSELNGGTY